MQHFTLTSCSMPVRRQYVRRLMAGPSMVETFEKANRTARLKVGPPPAFRVLAFTVPSPNHGIRLAMALQACGSVPIISHAGIHNKIARVQSQLNNLLLDDWVHVFFRRISIFSRVQLRHHLQVFMLQPFQVLCHQVPASNECLGLSAGCLNTLNIHG
jgi:hypothetical protein